VGCAVDRKNKRKHTYDYSVITMVHKSAGSALDSFQHVKTDGFDEGRLLTVKIRPDKGPIIFVSNVYNHVAAEGKQQQALLDQLGARLLHTESLGHVHLAGGDYNASLVTDARKGYSNSRETKEADVRFQKFTLDPQRSVARWIGHIKGGMFTRRSPQFVQAARLDEILVHAGNDQLPRDLEERSAQGFEFRIHTAHYGDSRLDHGILTADLPVTLLLRPMRAHSSSRDIVDRKKWDLMKDSWRAHVERAGNRTRSCADSINELTQWVNEATRLLPRKVTKTGPSKRKPAHSSKIQRACNRQIRLLEREAMIAKDLVTDGFIVTHSMRQIFTLAHIDAVAPIKLIPSSPSASDLNDGRMALQQGIRERRQ